MKEFWNHSESDIRLSIYQVDPELSVQALTCFTLRKPGFKLWNPFKTNDFPISFWGLWSDLYLPCVSDDFFLEYTWRPGRTCLFAAFQNWKLKCLLRFGFWFFASDFVNPLVLSHCQEHPHSWLFSRFLPAFSNILLKVSFAFTVSTISLQFQCPWVSLHQDQSDLISATWLWVKPGAAYVQHGFVRK